MGAWPPSPGRRRGLPNCMHGCGTVKTTSATSVILGQGGHYHIGIYGSVKVLHHKLGQGCMVYPERESGRWCACVMPVVPLYLYNVCCENEQISLG